MAKVTIIPSTKVSTFSNAFNPVVKRKVAAYARVSTDSDEQFTSFEAQCNYYENYINSKPDWELVKVYADEGISGTNTKNRTQFKQMIEDALGGKIDLIITKSISRFARNTLDTINYTRKLKAKGVEVYFEKENLLTFDDKKYINSFDDLYNELDNNKYRYFGYTSFQKKEWTLILNDLIQIYPNIEFI